MARYFGLGSDEPVEDSEKRVAASLKNLPDDWTIVHHVSWQSKRRGKEGDGEADFVIIHPKFGLLVLEVKGGGIEIIDGRWKSKDRFGVVHEIKNPFEQASDSKHALVKWLDAEGLLERVRVGHAVVFPHLDHVPWVGPAGTEAITWTRVNLSDIASAVKRSCNHWSLSGSLSEGDLKRLIALLAPTVSVRRRMGSDSADAETQIVQLTAEQIEAFAGLRAARGGLILGGAGTGKTVLAVARAQQLAQDGFHTLVVCFNELLGRSLEDRFKSEGGITAGTYHSFCFRQAKAANLVWPCNPASDWWESEAPNLLIEASARNGAEFDAVVVDEAQDFSPAWLESLRCLVKSNEASPFFLFADPRQELWGRNWTEGAYGQFTYQLRLNMRNTRPIAERVSAIIASSERIRDIPGPSPLWRDVHDSKKLNVGVITVVEQLLEEGFGPQNLIVLCGSAARVTRLRDYTVGSYSFGTWGSRGIPVETIARFKGMEAQAVVVVLEGGEDTELERTMAYVALSRARSVLAVVGSRSSQAFINWR